MVIRVVIAAFFMLAATAVAQVADSPMGLQRSGNPAVGNVAKWATSFSITNGLVDCTDSTALACLAGRAGGQDLAGDTTGGGGGLIMRPYTASPLRFWLNDGFGAGVMINGTFASLNDATQGGTGQSTVVVFAAGDASCGLAGFDTKVSTGGVPILGGTPGECALGERTFSADPYCWSDTLGDYGSQGGLSVSVSTTCPCPASELFLHTKACGSDGNTLINTFDMDSAGHFFMGANDNSILINGSKSFFGVATLLPAPWLPAGQPTLVTARNATQTSSDDQQWRLSWTCAGNSSAPDSDCFGGAAGDRCDPPSDQCTVQPRARMAVNLAGMSNPSSTADPEIDTAVTIDLDNDPTTAAVRVLVGPVGSGGAGYRALVIPSTPFMPTVTRTPTLTPTPTP